VCANQGTMRTSRANVKVSRLVTLECNYPCKLCSSADVCLSCESGLSVDGELGVCQCSATSYLDEKEWICRSKTSI
jgi:hypothetical protein